MRISFMRSDVVVSQGERSVRVCAVVYGSSEYIVLKIPIFSVLPRLVPARPPGTRGTVDRDATNVAGKALFSDIIGQLYRQSGDSSSLTHSNQNRGPPITAKRMRTCPLRGASTSVDEPLSALHRREAGIGWTSIPLGVCLT